jgi:hypothetical protein
MRKRNLGLIAAYKAVEKSFADYRKRVVEELGVDKDREFKHGVGKVERTTYDYSEGGDGKKETETFEVVDPNNISMYARYFAKDHSTEWNERQDYNLMFLKCQQKIANDLLHSRGHIFLNEVYDLLGFKRCPEGAVVGWAEGQGDDFVDFGIYNVDVDKYRDENSCDTVGEERLDFVNGTRNSILLDFNVSGVMYDLI